MEKNNSRRLQQTIQDLGGKASFTCLEGRSHFDLYQGGLLEQIAKEMNAGPSERQFRVETAKFFCYHRASAKNSPKDMTRGFIGHFI